jgi:hypothetical protein
VLDFLGEKTGPLSASMIAEIRDELVDAHRSFDVFERAERGVAAVADDPAHARAAAVLAGAVAVVVVDDAVSSTVFTDGEAFTAQFACDGGDEPEGVERGESVLSDRRDVALAAVVAGAAVEVAEFGSDVRSQRGFVPRVCSPAEFACSFAANDGWSWEWEMVDAPSTVLEPGGGAVVGAAL